MRERLGCEGVGKRGKLGLQLFDKFCVNKVTLPRPTVPFMNAGGRLSHQSQVCIQLLVIVILNNPSCTSS